VFNRWYRSYHGTDRNKVRAVVAQQGLLHPGVVTGAGVELRVRPGHIRDGVGLLIRAPLAAGDVRHVPGSTVWQLVPRRPAAGAGDAPTADELRAHGADARVFTPSRWYFTTPSLRYAELYSASELYDGRMFKLALKLRQAPPPAFDVLHETVDWRGRHPGEPLDAVVPMTQMEWFSPRLGPEAHVVTAIMVRVL
jgi:hypothetical protein